MSDADVVRRNLDKQREYYGELFGERVRRLVVGYDISQAQLAEVLGVSAPMLSQVMSGRRQKMANPAVWARLVMLERSLQTAQGDPQLRDRLVEVREATAAAAVLGAAAPGPDSIVAGLRECYPPRCSTSARTWWPTSRTSSPSCWCGLRVRRPDSLDLGVAAVRGGDTELCGRSRSPRLPTGNPARTSVNEEISTWR